MLLPRGGGGLGGGGIWSVLWTIASQSLSRTESADLVDTLLLPSKDYGKRSRLSRAIFEDAAGVAISAKDPATSFTYGEFPFTSLDTLLDKALEYFSPQQGNVGGSVRFLDLGSGCGRLCLYLALSRGGSTLTTMTSSTSGWQIHGIEVIEALHQEAKQAENLGTENGWFVDGSEQQQDSCSRRFSSLYFHHGLADEFPTVLAKADVVFMYSTAMQSGRFLPDVQGLLLSREWNELLARHCQAGCIVVTTDRALDPSYGWTLKDRFDVPNPEVFGSTGFIQQYKIS